MRTKGYQWYVYLAIVGSVHPLQPYNTYSSSMIPIPVAGESSIVCCGGLRSSAMQASGSVYLNITR